MFKYSKISFLPRRKLQFHSLATRGGAAWKITDCVQKLFCHFIFQRILLFRQDEDINSNEVNQCR